MEYLFLMSLDHTQRRTTVGILWTSDQIVAETSTLQHTTLTPDKYPCPPVVFEPKISAGERPCRSPAEILGSNTTGGHGYLSVVSVVCCQVEVSATS
jgi:hypothetical protein